MQKTYTSNSTGNKYKFKLIMSVIRSRVCDPQYRVKSAQLIGNAHVRFEGSDIWCWSQKQAEEDIDRQIQRWVDER